ncbi:MAG: hypothetical protein FJ290_19810 [Planctomycetes bacterium]|nr:hypothetical protein [Planctomycetota bacterium]
MRAMNWIGLIGLVVCTGCAGLGKYATDRGNDFLDCLTAQAGVGFLLPAVELRATHWVTAGAGFAVSEKWGLDGREAVTRGYSQAGFGMPGVLHLLGFESDKDFEDDGALKPFYTYTSRIHITPTFPLASGKGLRVSKCILLFDVTSIPRFAYHYDHDLRWRPLEPPRLIREERKLVEALDVHVDVTAALLLGPSLRLGFSPGQFADFVLGFFGLDIAGDDAKPQPPKSTEGDKK